MIESHRLASGVHWLSGFRPRDLSEIRAANLASFRLRAGALATVVENAQQLSFGENIPISAKLVIVGKLGANDAERRGAHWISEMQSVKNRGGYVILDYTDDHLAVASAMTPFYQSAIGLADLVVCSSPLLARNLADRHRGPIEVIPDAIEVVPIPPKTTRQSPMTILWFGHASNIGYLVEFLPRLADTNPIRLVILCNAEGLRMLQSHPSLRVPRNVRAEGFVWSVPQMLSAAAQSDLCIIPSNPSDRRKAGVSSNRLLTALAMGLPTAADLLDSYVPYADYFADIRGPQFRSMMENPTQFAEIVAAAQIGPVREHALPMIGRKWVELVAQVLGTS